MKRNKWQKIGAAALFAVVLGNMNGFPDSGLLAGYAAEGKALTADTPLSQYTAEEMAAFQDNVLEYWELPGLIEHYNTSYLNQLETYYGNPDGETKLTKDQLTDLAGKLRLEASELQDELDELDLEKSDELYKDYKSNIKVLKRYAKEMEDAAKGSATTRRALKIVRNQTILDVSGRMKNYQALASQEEIQKKNLEIATISYDSALRQSELGIYAKENLLAASDSLNAAKKAAETSAASAAQAKRELILELGWGYDGDPEIKTVPEPDMEKISGYVLETDMTSALNNNYDLSDLRRTKASELGGSTEKKRQIREMENSVRIQMEYLYRDVLQKQTAYQSALNSYAAAEAEKAQADRKYELGMMSRQEYLSAEVSWLTSKASKEQAGLDLTAAMEAYEWAMAGLMEL